MTRRTYVQHPDTGKMIPLEEVDWDRHRTCRPSFQIMPDIEPFVSPVDKTVVTSRSKLREHNERNNVVNFHEFDGHWEEKAKERKSIQENTHRPTKEDRIESVRAAYEEHMEKG